mgnify:CR=1 FL=1
MTVLTYIDHLQKQNYEDLAFYPLSTLEKALDARQVLTCRDNDELAGYLWHGAVKPFRDIRIFQACVDYDSRKRHLGWGMVSELIEIAKSVNATGIKLRCASNSDANIFWSMIGFYCTNVTKGGIYRQRDINHWRTDIQTPLLTVNTVNPSSKKINTTQYNANKQNRSSVSPFSRAHYLSTK